MLANSSHHGLQQDTLDQPNTTFTQINLISDGAVPAEQTDPNLINPWGVSYGPDGPFWISENGTGVTSVDSVTVGGVTVNAIPPITIAPSAPGAGPASPTGQVYNPFQSSGAFTLQDGSAATFLFATEDGTISGWNGSAGSESIIAVNNSTNPADGSEALGLGAVYKGLAIAHSADGPMLYAANFRHGTVDMFDRNFNQVGSFTDPNLPKGYAPFNVQVLDNKLFVTFALQNATKHDDVAGAAHGFVDEFDLEGHLLERVASGGPLDSPWGLAIAPGSFGKFAGDLLVGNFGSGKIDAYNLKTDAFQGALTDSAGKPIVIPDLWELTAGNGGSAGSPNSIYFTSGVQNEADGLFGSLTANPTPTFMQVNLISDGFVHAKVTDPNLINPWGVSYGPGGPFWISENNSGLTSVDGLTAGNVTLNAIPPITIAPSAPGAGPASPTGQVFNPFQASGAFTLQDGSAATFLFATEDGTISGWNGSAGSESIIAINNANNPAAGSEALGLGAVYKGLAVAHGDDGPTLYAANFRHGTVDMFDRNFNQVGSFTDTNLPKGYAPFNIQVLDNKLFVTFALQDATKHDDVAGAGHGFVDEFDLEGHLLERVASNGPLDSPWGLAIAPMSFGSYAGDLLVGNFGNGEINAFDLKNDSFQGPLMGANGMPIVIPDLWELIPGNGAGAGSPNALYFTSGVKDEAHGLFGSLMINPTPSTMAMVPNNANTTS